MTRRIVDRLDDITAAAEAIRAHMERGPLTDGLIFDAVRIRLVEIGEAVKALPAEVTGSEPEVPWRDVAGMRDFLAHRYFDTAFGVLAHTVERELPLLETAVQRLRTRLRSAE